MTMSDWISTQVTAATSVLKLIIGLVITIILLVSIARSGGRLATLMMTAVVCAIGMWLMALGGVSQLAQLISNQAK